MSTLPLEICILIIDAIGSRRRAGHWDDKQSDGECIHTLRACSLVCRAWYHHTIPHLWSSLVIVVRQPQKDDKDTRLTVRRSWREYGRNRRESSLPLAEVLDTFQSNPKLMASARHLFLSFPWTREKHTNMAAPELVAFCKALAPLPRFSWMADEVDDPTIFSTSFDDHLLGQIASPFCHSPTLTTFTFSGVAFPLDILKDMPNLKDVSFANVSHCVAPHSSLEMLSPQSLPFRLRRARFLGAECLYAILIHFEDVFSQLEDLVVESGVWEINETEENLVTLVCLPKGKLRTLDIEITNSHVFAQSLIERGSSLDFLRTVESCSIRIIDLNKLVTARHRTRLLDVLETAPNGVLSKLESLTLYLSFVKASLFDLVFDPECRAWCTAKHLLGPSTSPSLKSLSITTAWALSRNGDLKRDRENGVEERVASRCLEMLEECVPRWEDDARDVERILKVTGPHYVTDYDT